jgi:hypothetical protein
MAVNGLSPCLSAFPPPPTATQPPHLDVGENAAAGRERWDTHLVAFLWLWPVLRPKTGIIDVFWRLHNPRLWCSRRFPWNRYFCQFFALDFLSYRPLKKVWSCGQIQPRPWGLGLNHQEMGRIRIRSVKTRYGSIRNSYGSGTLVLRSGSLTETSRTSRLIDSYLHRPRRMSYSSCFSGFF